MDKKQQKQIFDDWLNRYKGLIFKIVRAYAFNLPDQDDLFQEIMFHLWQSIPEFRGEAKASTWIYRVALYTAAVWTRQEKRQLPTETLADVEHTLHAAPQPEAEQVVWLYTQIRQLEATERSLCLLMLDGFSYAEIAELLGISENNVGVKVHRLKQKLQLKLQETDRHGF